MEKDAASSNLCHLETGGIKVTAKLEVLAHRAGSLVSLLRLRMSLFAIPRIKIKASPTPKTHPHHTFNDVLSLKSYKRFSSICYGINTPPSAELEIFDPTVRWPYTIRRVGSHCKFIGECVVCGLMKNIAWSVLYIQIRLWKESLK